MEDASGGLRYLHFLCPEGHADCQHTIPFSPGLDGGPWSSGMAQWARRGDTFETLSLDPSIRRFPVHADREAALAAGCLPELVEEWMFCHMHVNLINGSFQFCGDSG